jgi:hypothetical protein
VALIHTLAAFATDRRRGLKTVQRDWSPFLVHFTSFEAMKAVQQEAEGQRRSDEILRLLDEADDESFRLAEAILRQGTILASPPRKSGLHKAVCLSECTLSGLISNSERYGRFGFAFRKETLFDHGARPCPYTSREVWGMLANRAGKAEATDEDREIHALANVYEPRQDRYLDFTHDREWRLLHDLEFRAIAPEVLLCPSRYTTQMQQLAPCVPVIPIDIMFEWGV